MEIELTAPHIKVSDKEREYIEKRMKRIDRLVERPIHCRVTLDRENIDYITEINFSVPGDTIFVKAHSRDQTKSIDSAVDKLVARLVKFKETRFSKI